MSDASVLSSKSENLARLCAVLAVKDVIEIAGNSFDESDFLVTPRVHNGFPIITVTANKTTLERLREKFGAAIRVKVPAELIFAEADSYHSVRLDLNVNFLDGGPV